MGHFCFSKKFWNPYLYSVSCDKFENGCPFSPLRCGFFQRKQGRKKGRPGGQQLFSPKHPDYEKTRKIYWPLPVGHTHTTFRDGSPEKAAQENTHTHTQTSSQDMKWRSKIRTEQSRKENPKMTTSIERKQTRTQHTKHQTNRRITKKNSKTEDKTSKQCRHKRQVGPKEGCVPNTKHNKNKYETTKNPLLPRKIVQEHETKTCSVDERNPPEKKETMILWKGSFARIPDRQTKWFVF